MASAYSNADGMMLPVGLEWPSVSAWLMAFLSKASAAARRTRRSCQGDFGSHWSGPKSSHWVAEMTVGTSLRPGVRFDLFAERAAQRVRDVDLAALEHGQPREVLGHDPPHQALHRRRLAPVAVVGLEDQLDARVDARRACTGPAPTGAFLKPSSPTFSMYFFGHDPARAGGRRGVEGHEVGPRLLQAEAHAVRDRRSPPRPPCP